MVEKEVSMEELLAYIELGRKLYRWVEKYIDEKAEFPTVREIAKHFHMRQTTILQLVEDNEDMDYAIGMRTYSGHYTFKRIGDYLIELL